MAGATQIIAIDINPAKFKLAKKLGATHCINPKDCNNDGDVRPVIVGELTDWGVDYSFDCTGNTEVMRTALEVAHRGTYVYALFDFLLLISISIFFLILLFSPYTNVCFFIYLILYYPIHPFHQVGENHA